MLVELLAQIADVGLQHAGVAAEVVVPHVVEQLRAGEHAARVEHQIAQEAVLVAARRRVAAGTTAVVVVAVGHRGADPDAGEPVDLTATEYRLLRYFMLNPRRVLTRAQLLEHVWEYDFGGDARVLETYVSYLRKKLDAHGPSLIHTVRGVGYALRRPRT